MSTSEEIRNRFIAELSSPFDTACVFDQVPDLVFFVKDRVGRYIAANETLLRRCGLEDRSQLVGRTATSLFPSPLGELFTEQDESVLTTGISIINHLELHLYPDGTQGWCLTFKEPIRGADGRIIGISGISRDLRVPRQEHEEYQLIAKAVEHIHQHFDEPLRLPELAKLAKLSVYQLDQRIRRLFNITPGQYITKVRIEHACQLLRRSENSIVDIALDCGFGDQSAFSRQFKASVGMTPSQYRKSR